MIRKIIVATVCVTVWSLAADYGLAQRNGQEYLFAQYYTQPGASSAHAEMYPAPHPVPAHVGNSYYTYQPLMPHEMMYTHSRNYYNYYASPSSFYCDMCGGHHNRPGYGFNKTTVRWQSGRNSVAPLPGTLFPFTKLQYLWNRHHHAGPQPGNCLHQRIKGYLASGGCLGHGCKGGCAGGDCGDAAWSGDSYGGGYEDGYGGYDGYDSGCSDCAANWSSARQQAVARAASRSAERYTR